MYICVSLKVYVYVRNMNVFQTHTHTLIGSFGRIFRNAEI